MLKLQHRFIFSICLLLGCTTIAVAQPTWTFDPFGKEKKPEKYEEKKLASEKTGEKNFGTVRRIIQNGTSRFNFYFNANNKLNAVIERAKIANKDDYAKLLPFYPYNLDNTASQKTELDSIIYKSTAGILLHDLRSDWVDNFYLLIGKSYFYKKDFDSAALTFQFINYNLFPRKRKNDDDNKIVGTNEEGSGVGSVSIANKEKRSVIKKVLTLAPSRNEALIWQIRTFIEQNQLGDAAGLISILQNDKNLPARLQNDLAEVTAYWFYNQNIYDSAAVHLKKALTNADTKQDKSRWEYLLAQLYENTGQFNEASTYYFKAAQHTTDPVMDIYARLSEAKMMRNSGNNKELDNSIANLLKMARKDRFEEYRDIIYYSIGQLSLQKPDTTNGIGYYLKSIAYNSNTSNYKDRSYLQLGDIAFVQRRYIDAGNFYDSLTVATLEKDFDTKPVEDRKDILSRLVPFLKAIQKEDSLQKLASLPEAERNAILKKMVKKYRKENGLKEEDFGGDNPITFANNKAPEDLFKTNGSSSGEWYFYNASLRSKGFTSFKSKWGKRPNVDNWRRKVAAEASIVNSRNNGNISNNLDPDAKVVDGATKPDAEKKENAFSFESLLDELPLTTEKLAASNKVIANNLYDAAQIFQNEIKDYTEAINSYERFATQFEKNEKIADVYVGLSYCYSKIGDKVKADYYASLVKNNYPGTMASAIINNPASLKSAEKNPTISAKYAAIYDLFLEGNFEKAIAAKKTADSLYGKNYWTPQLLYIEAVYYIKEKKDSNAIAVLQNIEKLYAVSPLKEKATTLISVLQRRAEIEQYLTNLQVTREEEEKVIVGDDKVIPATQVKTVAPKAVEPKTIAPSIVTRAVSDTIKVPEIYKNKSFTLQPEKAHYVVMILDKIDGVYVNEAKNAFTRFNKESMATINIAISKDAVDAQTALLLFTPFENATEALKYFDRIKKAASTEVSWLQPSKYSFIIITESNLKLLKENKDFVGYKQLLNNNYGNKF
ncbi:hypothetical protein ACFOWM_13375 [Ferruginibacter yonginensis]|uniref:Tetratricopeptide repeat protein n=1 Tax=Ferruginibacter yonginensis TaxID=1310416 RepID=A0ABV8QY26_9BACT